MKHGGEVRAIFIDKNNGTRGADCQHLSVSILGGGGNRKLHLMETSAREN